MTVRVERAHEDRRRAVYKGLPLRELLDSSARGEDAYAVSNVADSMAVDLNVPPFMLCGSPVGTQEETKEKHKPRR